MSEYHKINGVFERYTGLEQIPEGFKKGDFKKGIFAKAEYEYLYDTPWEWTEKVNGMNCRIVCESSKWAYSISIKGKTSNSMIPSKLLDWFEEWRSQNREIIETSFPEGAILYGEGIGPGLQKNEGAIDSYSIVLFDVLVDSWWLRRDSVDEVGKEINLETVNVVSTSSLKSAINHFEIGEMTPSHVHGGPMEGWVGRPSLMLFDRGGSMIITKLKWKDFI